MQSQKEDKIQYLVTNGFNRTTLEGDTLATLRQKANAIAFDKFQMEMRKKGGKSKRKRGDKRKHSRRHKTRRHSKK